MYHDKKKKIKQILITLIIVFGIIILGLSIFKLFFVNEQDELIKGNGRIESRETTVATKFYGRLAEINVNEGDIVKKGQLLATIDSRSISAELEAQKAKSEEILKQIASVDAEFKATNSDIKFYRKEVQRTKTLIKQNFSSQFELDRNNNYLEKFEAKLLSLKANKKALQASYKSALASIKSTEINIEDMKIYAPTNGVILYKLVENGEMLAAGGKLFIMYNPDDLYMTIYMPSEGAGQIKLGQDAKIKLDAYSDKIFNAKVTFIAENAEFTPKEVETQKEREKLVFRIKLTLNDNSSREAKPGMPGNGYIKLNSNKSWSSLEL
ncbi:MAG: efflux RND transporter periplasmic adaptor subunit [Rickettsiales bacterium]|nr:efflux RND transporter periplasmic adaptor subunit [Rickettsiales bacterium]